MSFVQGALGHYEAQRVTDEPDCVIANSFGTGMEEDSVNAAIKIIALRASSLYKVPLILDTMLHVTRTRYDRLADLVVGGPISDIKGGGIGTWGVLVKANDFMDERGLRHPLLVGQAYHINRIRLQAIKLGLDPIVPPDLPRGFDAHSSQIWTQSAVFWLPRELVGSLVLKKQGKL